MRTFSSIFDQLGGKKIYVADTVLCFV